MSKISEKTIREVKIRYSRKNKSSAKELLKIDLYDLYREYNAFYFDYKLPKADKVTIKWSKRMTKTAGRCFTDKKLIKLSMPYHKKYPKELEGTLVHEKIHLLIPNHGPDFRHKARKINNLAGERIITIYSRERALINYVAVCPNHGDIGTRSNKPRDGINYYCTRCGEDIKWIELNNER